MSPPRKNTAQLLAQAHPLIGKDPEAALGFIHQAIELDPRNPQAWFYLASVHHHARRPAEALAAFQKTAELDGGTAPAINGVMVCLKRLHRYDEAREAFLACKDKTHFNLRAGYADLHKDLGDVVKAMELLLETETLVKDDGDRGLFWYNRACYDALLGRPAEALASLERAFAFAPKYKQSAPRDPDFTQMLSDPRFRTITGQ